jgi:hypothetical protein
MKWISNVKTVRASGQKRRDRPKMYDLPRDPENESGEKVCPSVLNEPGVL